MTNNESTILDLKRVHVADVKIQDHTERITWIYRSDKKVNILVSEQIVGTSFGPQRLIGKFAEDESEEAIKELCRDYVRRQNHPHLDPIPMSRVAPEDMRPAPERPGRTRPLAGSTK